MYGMVNEGIRTFVVNNYDEATWRKICADAGLEQTEFERMENYRDATTYQLVGAVCAHTGLSAAEVLETFGEYWVEFANASPFANLMRLAGETFADRVRGLDDMHERIQLSMPHLKPPTFDIEEAGDGVWRVRYYSEREGLAPMAIGLLYGLAADTGEKIAVAHVAGKSDDLDHELFEVTLIG